MHDCAAYHYAVRSIKKDEYNIRCERIMNSAGMNDDRSFWAEIKKIRNAKPAKCKTCLLYTSPSPRD